MPSTEKFIKKYDVVVIGGGSSGTVISKKLNDIGYNVSLIERGPEIISDGFSISNGIPYRGSAGFHYSDIKTGKKILEASVNFWKNYSDIYPNRITYYLVMKNSVPNPDEIINTYKEYRKYYSEFIDNYPEITKRYGSYDEFFKILDEESLEFNNLKKILKEDYFKNIKYIVKTYEGLIDGESVINKIKKEIYKSKNIDIYINKKVNSIKQKNDYYIIETNNEKYETPIVILTSWHANESLIKNIENKLEIPIITKRLKALCNVYINLEWCENVGLTSMFECMGAGFMISLPKGESNIVIINNKSFYKAKITYATITNIYKYDDIDEPKWVSDLLIFGKVSEMNQKYVPDKIKNKLINIDKLIFDGVANKIEGFKENSIISGIKYGIVCTEGKIDENIEKEFSMIDSNIHKRSYLGLYKLQECEKKILIANYGMKFIYCTINADETEKILNNYKKKQIEYLGV